MAGDDRLLRRRKGEREGEAEGEGDGAGGHCRWGRRMEAKGHGADEGRPGADGQMRRHAPFIEGPSIPPHDQVLLMGWMRDLLDAQALLLRELRRRRGPEVWGCTVILVSWLT
jgi:hypothetical protein